VPRATVLVVDPDPLALVDVAAMLDDVGFDVISCTEPSRALEMHRALSSAAIVVGAGASSRREIVELRRALLLGDSAARRCPVVVLCLPHEVVTLPSVTVVRAPFDRVGLGAAILRAVDPPRAC
jgi:PleD family two-component response regulator